MKNEEMKHENLYTREKTPQKIPAKDGYLTILAYTLYRHHNAHYPDEYIRVPVKLIGQYIEYTGEKHNNLHTELRRLDGLSADTFQGSFKKRMTDIAENERDQAIQELYAFLEKEMAGREETLKFHRVENSHIDFQPLKNLLKTRADEEDLIKVPSIPHYLLKKVRARINKVAESQAKLEALDHVQLHIDLTGEYKFKKIAESAGHIYRLMGKPDLTSRDDLKKLVNQAIMNYEIENNPDFIFNENLYYQSVYNSFKNKMEKN